MRRPPPISKIPAYPVTGGIAILAVAISVGWWLKQFPVAQLEMTSLAWHGQPWRLLTSALPHANILHLAFDVYWFWIFGTIVEEVFGSLRLLAIVIVLAAGSSAAQFAIFSGGIGLSGVGYGLFAFLWALSRREKRFEGVIDKQTIQLFVGWFFLCIVLTIANLMPIANVAHASGAILGGILGYMLAVHGPRRVATASVAGAVLAVFIIFASALRPLVNFSVDGGYDEFKLGYDALIAGNNQQAVKCLERASAYRDADWACWVDMGLAYERVGRDADAARAFAKAAKLKPASAPENADSSNPATNP